MHWKPSRKREMWRGRRFGSMVTIPPVACAHLFIALIYVHVDSEPRSERSRTEQRWIKFAATPKERRLFFSHDTTRRGLARSPPLRTASVLRRRTPGKSELVIGSTGFRGAEWGIRPALGQYGGRKKQCSIYTGLYHLRYLQSISGHERQGGSWIL